MTRKDGFIIGIVTGFFTTLIGTGTIFLVPYTETSRIVALIILFSFFLFGLTVNAYEAINRDSFGSTTFSGGVSGFLFSEGILIFLLYGKFI